MGIVNRERGEERRGEKKRGSLGGCVYDRYDTMALYALSCKALEK